MGACVDRSSQAIKWLACVLVKINYNVIIKNVHNYSTLDPVEIAIKKACVTRAIASKFGMVFDSKQIKLNKVTDSVRKLFSIKNSKLYLKKPQRSARPLMSRIIWR